MGYRSDPASMPTSKKTWFWGLNLEGKAGIGECIRVKKDFNDGFRQVMDTL